MTTTNYSRQSSGTLAGSQLVGVFELSVHMMYSNNPLTCIVGGLHKIILSTKKIKPSIYGLSAYKINTDNYGLCA